MIVKDVTTLDTTHILSNAWPDITYIFSVRVTKNIYNVDTRHKEFD